MEIYFLPIDNRPVCYSLAKDICALDSAINLNLPPREFLGDLNKQANISGLLNWLKNIKNADAIILSLDTLIYGGLIPSRRSTETIDDLNVRLGKLKNILKNKKTKIYAFSSIMRISNNNYNEEEKEYWAKYGKKIFEYSFNTHKFGSYQTDVPQEILNDYLETRKRNFEVNKTYLSWQKEGIFKTLIFSKDDCAEFGFNVLEANELEKLGGKTKTGADEIPLTLLAKSIEKNIKIFVKYTEEDYKNCISNYEDISIEKSVLGQLELCGFEQVLQEKNADLVLIINNFIEKQGELVMGWKTKNFNKDLILPDKPFAVADVRFANGADNKFVEKLLELFNNSPNKQIILNNFYGYAGWNTSANTLGTTLATIKAKWNAKKYNNDAFKKLQLIRFLDDWAYQANVRKQIPATANIKQLMKNYEKMLFDIFEYEYCNSIKYSYPWDRKFEVEIVF